MRAVFYYFERDLVKWLRGRVTVISSLVMPAAWLVFVGLALPTKFTDNYLEFITPGILVMTMLFSSLQGGSLMIFDSIIRLSIGYFNLESYRYICLILVCINKP